METKSALDALAALAQKTRLAIFRHLVVAGEEGAAAGAIAQALGLAPATLSFHLKGLSHARLVAAAQEGRSVRYTADYATMNALVAYLNENCCGGKSCVPRASRPARTRRKR